MAVTGLVFSYGRGIIHPYYTVALAPLVGGTLAIGAGLAWVRRESIPGRALLAVSVAATAAWAAVLLDRTPSWAPWLPAVILLLALAGAIGMLLWPLLRLRGARFAVAGAALLAALLGPAGYAWATVSQPHTGAIPSAGPAGAGGFPGGGPGGGFARRAFGGFGGPSAFGGAPALGGPFASGGPSASGGPAASGGAFGGAGGAGGLLGGGSVSAQTANALKAGGHYRWLMATVGSENASTYQLATGEAVMSIGGFNGTDPAPTLAQFEAYVAAHQIHWFVAGGGGPGAVGGGGGGSSESSQITAWVEAHFTEKTVGGVTVYDLTSPSS